MQDKYVGDIGDFGKFALLRWLQQDSRLTLGVAWYWAHSSIDGIRSANDGKHIRYLGLDIKDGKIVENEELVDKILLRTDPELFRKLKEIVLSDRTVAALESSNLLKNAIYYSADMSFVDVPPAIRASMRSEWHRESLSQLSKSEIIFMDPDNGLASNDISPGRKKAGKYILRHELQRFWEAGPSALILYHHLNWSESHDIQREKLKTSLESLLPDSHVFSMRYRRGTARAYVFVVRRSEAATWQARIAKLNDAWLSSGFINSWN
jgi:hypothetical protein